MTGTELITLITNNLPTVMSTVTAVAGTLFTTIFLRRNTSATEFEKIKCGQLKEAADELLKSGKMTYTEYYKANNFLAVAKKADEYYKNEPRKEMFDAYDFDWFIRFYEAVGNISNEEMQVLWAKILAGKISHSSTYSLRTIDVLKNLSKSDATLFEKICRHSIYSDGSYFLPRYDNYLDNSDIRYSEIMKLNELGLIYNDGTIVLKVKPMSGINILLSNNNLIITYDFADSNRSEFDVPQYPFTQVGYELASLKGLCATDQEFIDFAKEIKEAVPSAKIAVHRIIQRCEDHIQYETASLMEEDNSTNH